jgi:hypothetical protein
LITEDPFKVLDAALNAELDAGAEVFQTINDYWRLGIREVTCLNTSVVN